jgi:hypothetical protein
MGENVVPQTQRQYKLYSKNDCRSCSFFPHCSINGIPNESTELSNAHRIRINGLNVHPSKTFVVFRILILQWIAENVINDRNCELANTLELQSIELETKLNEVTTVVDEQRYIEINDFSCIALQNAALVIAILFMPR